MRRLIAVSLLLLASLPTAMLVTANGSHAGAPCPLPTEALGGQCVLRADATINETLWLASDTHLNCRGHRLTPAVPGVLDDPRTMTNEFRASIPDLAMFVHRSYNVKIQNCVIDGFDFGIIVAQSKSAGAPGQRPSANKILGNTIHVRTLGVNVIKSDDVLVSDNAITYDAERGRGVVVDFDSDHNEISHNRIVSTDAASTGQVRQLPGGPFVTSTAIMDNEIHLLNSDKPLQNFVVSGLLFQVPGGDPLADIDDASRTSGNVIASNDIVDDGVGASCTFDPGTSCRADAECAGKGVCLLKQNSGVGFNIRASDTLVRGNRLSGRMDRGISFGGVGASMTFPNWFPGSCTQDSTRMCSVNADCSIPGYDTTDLGPCVGVGPATVNGNSVGLTAEANALSGIFDTAALFANNSDRFVFRGNSVEGGASGVRLSVLAINGTVERNVVSGSSNALYLGFHPSFSNMIRLNDFTSYAVAIRTSNDFRTSTDLAAGGFGNHWGLSCDPGFDPSRVLFDNGSVNPFVFDAHPYGQPVARTPDESLPNACR